MKSEPIRNKTLSKFKITHDVARYTYKQLTAEATIWKGPIRIRTE